MIYSIYIFLFSTKLTQFFIIAYDLYYSIAIMLPVKVNSQPLSFTVPPFPLAIFNSIIYNRYKFFNHLV